MINELPIVASLVLALAAAWVALTVGSVLGIASGDPSPLEIERRGKLRNNSAVYRRWELLVDELSAVNQSLVSPRTLDAIRHSLSFVRGSLPWRPAEFLAVKQLGAVAIGGLLALFCAVAVSPGIAVGIGAIFGFVYYQSAVRELKLRAEARSKAIRARMPFVVDLIGLMIEAGATFNDALRTAARENQQHPVGEELSEALAQTDMGRPRAAALAALQERIADQDVSDLVVAINRGEELGTPLSVIMRTQSDQMRLKRAQWGEKAAAEAQIRMTGPAMIIMIACMAFVVGPFILDLVNKMG